LDENKYDPDRFIYNNLFRGGSVSVDNSGTVTWTIKDNLFDQTTINSQWGFITHSNNAYVSGFSRLTPTNSNDVVLSNAPTYQTSYLGRYYYLTNDGMLSLLIDAGSRWATNATLYHFTTTTNQVKEASSKVDIGFHFAATDATGIPFDTDGDGILDYLEDRNGDGNGANDTTSWQTYNSPNGLVTGAGLQVFTPLKQ